MARPLSEERASLRNILRSTSIVGGATIASLAFGLARMKALALLAGPAGVGLFGVLNVLFTTGATVAGLGLSTSGVRQVAAAPPGSDERAWVEKSVWTLTWLCAVLGALGFWVFEQFFYAPSAGLPADAPSFPWLAVAVGLATLNATQLLMLQAQGRVGDIARVRVWASAFSALFGVAAVYLLGDAGLYVAVFAVPFTGLLVALAYSRRRPCRLRLPWNARMLGEWSVLLKTGVSLTIASFIGSAGQLLVRSIIADQGGLEAAGLFQAAWTISALNLSIVLSAMAVGYFPALSAVSNDKRAMSSLLNQQLHVALLLGSPVLVACAGTAPWLISLLYSDRFSPAAPLLQLQLAGDVVKLAGWALGFVVLVLKDDLGYILSELAFDAVMVGVTWLCFSRFGLPAAGVAYLLGHIAGAAVSAQIAARRGVGLDRANLRRLFRLWLLAIGLITGSSTYPVATAIVSLVITAWLGWTACREIITLGVPVPAPVKRLVAPFTSKKRT